MKRTNLLKKAALMMTCAAMLLIPSQTVQAEEMTQPEITFDTLYPFFVATNWSTFDETTQQGAILLLADEISEELGVETPKITFDKNMSQTTAGQTILTNYEATEIQINANLIYSGETAIRVISHELRHVWQTANCPWVFHSYVRPEESMNQYKKQDAEIDARNWEDYEYLKFLTAMRN